MRILLANDDGISAPGLEVLERALATVGDVWVVAPNKERSAQSHALTMHKPLFARPSGPQRWAVNGTPADCVYLGLHRLLPGPPDVVVSGINRGANLGYDVHYSGTVAAAREGALHGFRALSVSLNCPAGRPSHWETAAEVAVRIVRAMVAGPAMPGVHLNLNVPDVAMADLRGVRSVPLGERRYTHAVESRQDPRGRTYHWIGGPPLLDGGPPDSDGPAVDAGFAALTPLSIRPDHLDSLEILRAWTDREDR